MINPERIEVRDIIRFQKKHISSFNSKVFVAASNQNKFYDEIKITAKDIFLVCKIAPNGVGLTLTSINGKDIRRTMSPFSGEIFNVGWVTKVTPIELAKWRIKNA